MVRKVLSIGALCLFALSLSAASPEEQISSRGNAWAAAFNAGDATALGALYSSDGVLMPPNAPAVKGPQAIAAFLAPFFGGEAKMSIVTAHTELQVHGDVAHRVGTWRMAGEDGKVVDHGKFIELWKYSGDRWLMTHDIWNSDVAPAQAEH